MCETLYKCSARGNSVPLWRVCFCMSASRNEHVRSGSLGSSSSSSRVRLYWGGPANTNMWLVLLLKRHDICVNSDARVPCWGIQRPWCEVHFQGVLTPVSLSVSSLRWQTSIVSKFWQKSPRDILMSRERRRWTCHLNQSEKNLITISQSERRPAHQNSPSSCWFLCTRCCSSALTIFHSTLNTHITQTIKQHKNTHLAKHFHGYQN